MHLTLGEKPIGNTALIEHLDCPCEKAAGSRAREHVIGRRSTTATSTFANASSAASIMPVGPPPAITTACSAMRGRSPSSVV